VLEARQQLSVVGQDLDTGAAPADALLHRDVPPGQEPLHQRFELSRRVRPPHVVLASEPVSRERGARLDDQGKREQVADRAEVLQAADAQPARHPDTERLRQVTTLELVEGDPEGLVLEQVDGPVKRLEVVLAELERQDRGIVARQHEIEALPPEEVQQPVAPFEVLERRRRHVVPRAHVP
jgi:hypothetical protein